MNKKMYAAFLAAVMMISMGCAALAESLMYSAMPAAKITVQGTAQIYAEPDIVTVTANASVTAGSVGAAQDEMGAIVQAAADKLLALGVLDEDIVTTSYSYYPRYNYDTDTLTGYEANHTLEITCRDVEMLDGVISALTDSGFSNIYSVNYDISARSELYQQALDMAIARAEAKALRMAQTSGVTLTGILSLTENGGYNEGYVVNTSMDGALMRSASGSTGIRSGTVSVSASVTAEYEAAR